MTHILRRVNGNLRIFADIGITILRKVSYSATKHRNELYAGRAFAGALNVILIDLFTGANRD